MKLKLWYLAIACALAVSAFAESTDAPAHAMQFMLIVRSKADAKPTATQFKTNIKHWQEFMGGLAKDGVLDGGYRPGPGGLTISGKQKVEKAGSYAAENDVVSSVLIINAPNLDKAKEIAAKCPVFELDGSVEIRPM